jgi:hypothetical protein
MQVCAPNAVRKLSAYPALKKNIKKEQGVPIKEPPKEQEL